MLDRALDEEPGLDFKITLQVTVIVEVITTEVRENCGFEADAVNAILVERMRGHLDRRVPGAMLTKFGQLTVQLHRVRRCHVRRRLDFANARTERAEISAPAAQQVEALSGQPGHRRLAVRPGHADDAHLAGRKIIEPVCDFSEAAGETGNRNDGNTDVACRRRRRVRVKRDCGDAEPNGVLDEIKSVACFAADREEERTSL